MKRIKSSFALMAVLCMALISCNKHSAEPDPKPDLPPAVPSIETLKLDLSTVPIQDTKGLTDSCKILSRLYSSFLKFFTEINEAVINVPTAGLEIVASAEPTNDGGIWSWSVSDWNFIGQQYVVSLLGEEQAGKMVWNLNVSRDGTGGFQNYTWITGWSEKDGSAGQWNVRVSPYDTDVLVTSDWTASEGRLETCRLTYSLEHSIGSIGAFFNNSFIEYSHTTSAPEYSESLSVSYFQIGNISAGFDLEWDAESGACHFRFGPNAGWHDMN